MLGAGNYPGTCNAVVTRLRKFGPKYLAPIESLSGSQCIRHHARWNPYPGNLILKTIPRGTDATRLQ